MLVTQNTGSMRWDFLPLKSMTSFWSDSSNDLIWPKPQLRWTT